MTVTVANALTLMILTAGLTGPVPAGTAPSGRVPVARVPGMSGVSDGSGRFQPATRAVAAATGQWPLRPRPDVLAGFDPPLTRFGGGHRGVDLAGRAGQRVRAPVAGRVTFAGSVAGRGVVVVSHGATRTTYEPVDATIRVGSAVSAGDVLGRLQSVTGHCTPTVCLHWGLVEGDTYLDPLTLLGAGPVRLLPLFGAGTGGGGL